jgi:hypothetical protein
VSPFVTRRVVASSPRVVRDQEREAERDARARVSRDRALDEVVLEAIPDAEPLSRGRVDMEGHELANAERVIAAKLLLEGPALRRIARAEDLEGEVGGSFLPDEVRVEVVVGHAEGDERVRRQAAPRRCGVEVDELVGADGVLRRTDGAEHLVERVAEIVVAPSLSHALLVRLLLREAERLDRADVTERGRA